MEDATNGCYATFRNAAPHKHICQGKLPKHLQIGHIILPYRPVSKFNHVQGDYYASTHSYGPGESYPSGNTNCALLHLLSLLKM